MRKNAAVLARDIAAVWTGLRAAVMVDYMLLSSSSMLDVLKSLATGNSQGMFAKHGMLMFSARQLQHHTSGAGLHY